MILLFEFELNRALIIQPVDLLIVLLKGFLFLLVNSALFDIRYK